MVRFPDTSLKSHCPEAAERLITWPAVQSDSPTAQTAKADPNPTRLLPPAFALKSAPETFTAKKTNPRAAATSTLPLVICLEFAGTNENRTKEKAIRKFLSM